MQCLPFIFLQVHMKTYFEGGNSFVKVKTIKNVNAITLRII